MIPFRSDLFRTLTSDRPLRRRLGQLARDLVPSHADFCGIHLLQGETLACVARAHVTRAGDRLMDRLDRAYRILLSDPASTSALVARTGRPQLRTSIVCEPPAQAARTEVLDLHRRVAPRSALVLPLVSRAQILGSLTLCYARSGRDYGSGDVKAASELASHITRAIEEESLTHVVHRHAVLDREAQPALSRMRHCLARLRAGAPAAERMRLLGEVARQERLLRRLLGPSSPIFSAVSSLPGRRPQPRARV